MQQIVEKCRPCNLRRGVVVVVIVVVVVVVVVGVQAVVSVVGVGKVVVVSGCALNKISGTMTEPVWETSSLKQAETVDVALVYEGMKER